jgi:hypothetical protein
VPSGRLAHGPDSASSPSASYGCQWRLPLSAGTPRLSAATASGDGRPAEHACGALTVKEVWPNHSASSSSTAPGFESSRTRANEDKAHWDLYRPPGEISERGPVVTALVGSGPVSPLRPRELVPSVKAPGPPGIRSGQSEGRDPPDQANRQPAGREEEPLPLQRRDDQRGDDQSDEKRDRVCDRYPC